MSELTEDAIEQNLIDLLQQQNYYQALGSADSVANSTVLIIFIVQALENAPQNALVNIKGLKTP
ncbi:MAG: hypothetical protein ACC707_19795, partial [Thiohalomonadales bacterium]